MKSWELELLLRGINDKVESALKANDELEARVDDIDARLTACEKENGVFAAHALGAIDDDEFDVDVDKLLENLSLPEKDAAAFRERGSEDGDTSEDDLAPKPANDADVAESEEESPDEDEQENARSAADGETEEVYMPPTLDEFDEDHDALARALSVLNGAGTADAEESDASAPEDAAAAAAEAEQARLAEEAAAAKKAAEDKAAQEEAKVAAEKAAREEEERRREEEIQKQFEDMRAMMAELKEANDKLRADTEAAEAARKQAELEAQEAKREAKEAADKAAAEKEAAEKAFQEEQKRREDEEEERRRAEQAEREREAEEQRKRLKALLDGKAKARSANETAEIDPQDESVSTQSSVPSQEQIPAPVAEGDQGETGRSKKFMFFTRRPKQEQQEHAPEATAPAGAESDATRLVKVVGYMMGKLKFKVRDDSLALAACIRAVSKNQSDVEALCDHYGISSDDYRSLVAKFVSSFGLANESEIARWVKQACWPENQ